MSYLTRRCQFSKIMSSLQGRTDYALLHSYYLLNLKVQRTKEINSQLFFPIFDEEFKHGCEVNANNQQAWG